ARPLTFRATLAIGQGLDDRPVHRDAVQLQLDRVEIRNLPLNRRLYGFGRNHSRAGDLRGKLRQQERRAVQGADHDAAYLALRVQDDRGDGLGEIADLAAHAVIAPAPLARQLLDLDVAEEL